MLAGPKARRADDFEVDGTALARADAVQRFATQPNVAPQLTRDDYFDRALQ